MTPLLALVGAWGLGELIIAVIIVAAVIAIALVAIRGFGLQVPSWVVQIFWICLIAVVAVVAIRVVLSL